MRHCKPLTALISLLVGFMFDAVDATHAQTILVLRDLSVIETAQLSFDQDQVTTREGKSFGWDQVLKTDLSQLEQEKFDRQVREIGLPLFRLRHRLSTNDDHALKDVVEPLLKSYQSEPLTSANSRRKYLIHLAAFRYSMVTGRRADALLSFSRLCAIHKEHPQANQDFESFDFSDQELELEFTNRLLPIFFDPTVAVRVSSNMTTAATVRLENQDAGWQIYAVSLLITAGKHEAARVRLKQLARLSSELVDRWLPLLQVELEIASQVNGAATSQLRSNYQSMPGPERALSNYLIAKQSTQRKEDYDLAILDLLYIPANFGSEFPDLSAAALHEAARISKLAGHIKEADKIRKRMREEFPATYHSRRADR